jgi:glycosyltransferase involved in cell wall biosynthesis
VNVIAQGGVSTVGIGSEWVADRRSEAPSKALANTMPSVVPEPLVSVVIPNFNRLQCLGLSLGGVLAQTFKNIEIIVKVNASEEDPTPSVAAVADARIRLFRNPTNIRQTANIVTACARATGKYIAIIGDDDVCQPDFLAKLLPALKADPEIIASFCAHNHINVQGRLDSGRTEAVNGRQRSRLSQGPYGPFVRIALVNRAICAVWAAMLRSEAIALEALPQDQEYDCDNHINYLD